MAKSADAFRTISEVAEILSVPAHVLRFWESRFTQVKPVKRAGGRRYYRPDDIRLLSGIRKLLHDDGMTIKGVQKILREQGVQHVAKMAPALSELADAGATAEVVNFERRGDAGTAVPAPEEDEVQAVSDPLSRAAAQDLDPVPDAPLPKPPATHPHEPAPAGGPEDQPRLNDTPASAASPEIEAPRLPPLPDLPGDPPDAAPAAPGALSALAGVQRPVPPDLARRLAMIAARLRDPGHTRHDGGT